MRKLVQDPDAITSAWRVNHGAAKPGSHPQPVSVMPPAPAAYHLPKAVLYSSILLTSCSSDRIDRGALAIAAVAAVAAMVAMAAREAAAAAAAAGRRER